MRQLLEGPVRIRRTWADRKLCSSSLQISSFPLTRIHSVVFIIILQYIRLQTSQENGNDFIRLDELVQHVILEEAGEIFLAKGSDFLSWETLFLLKIRLQVAVKIVLLLTICFL